MKILIVIPAYNEEKILEKNVLKLFDFCQKNLADHQWQIVIADNKSSDRTAEIGESLARQHQAIQYFYVPEKGKGRAIRESWQKFAADIYCFMDTDLSADIKHLPELVQAIKNGYEVAIGSRFVQGARAERTVTRQVFSWGLRFILKLFLGLKIKDAPCGFKAVNKKVVQELVPKIQSQEWFFDTELLVLAQRAGYKIKEMPIFWTDQGDKLRQSRVNTFAVIKNYLTEIRKFRRRLR